MAKVATSFLAKAYKKRNENAINNGGLGAGPINRK